MTKVSIVILNWNRANDTIECLKSISQLSTINYQLSVTVVDNGSTDNSVSIIEKKLKKIVRKKNVEAEVIKNENNLGFAAGNNIGIKHALNHKAEFILILNNDTVVGKNLISELLKSAKKYLKAGVISPKIYFAKGFEFHKSRYRKSEFGKVIWYAGGEIDWDNVYGANRGVNEVDKGQYGKVLETDFATGACMFCRAKSLKDVGMFDEKYYMYLEDADLSQRMKNAGWKVLYSPKGHLWHKVAQSSAIGGDLNDYFISRNRLLFGMRYAKFRTRLALYKESLNLILNGREWQKKGVIDFYLRRFGRGSW
jgi:GT2 family glycosyltransferase